MTHSTNFDTRSFRILRISSQALLILALISCSLWAQTAAPAPPDTTRAPVFDPADLNHDGVVNVIDAQLAINMSLGIAPCKANSGEANACSGNFVDQVLKSTLVKAMVTTGSPSVSLSWVASTSPNITGYDVLRSQTTGGPYTTLNASPVTTTSYTDSTVKAGSTYYYVATAINSSKEQSGYSNQAKAVVAASHSVTLSWSASTSPNIAGYNVLRASASAGPYQVMNTSLVTTTSYADTSVQAGLTYYYVATAVNKSNSQSAYSNQAKALVP